MPKVNVTRECQKCGRKFVYSKDTEKGNGQGLRVWIKENITLCPQCFNENENKSRSQNSHNKDTNVQKSRRDAQQEEEEKILNDVILVDLNGTGKQIGWATRLRREALCMIYKSYEPNDGLIALVNDKDDANWWIDNKEQLTTVNSFLVLLTAKE